MVSPLLVKAQKPAIIVSGDSRTIDAVRVMVESKVGAAIVLVDGRAVGIFTERDLMAKVVLGKLDPETTPVSAVMTQPVATIDKDAHPNDAIALMVERHIRHLPVVDGDGKVLGMLSIRHLMQEEIEDLEKSVDSLQAYMGADGVGG
jgi:CBS domain-containing protein